MSTNNSNKPKLRFKGFSDDWEQRKLDTITDVRDGTHDSPQYLETGHPFITSKNVKDGFINYEDIQYVSDKDYEEINKRSKVDKNDILMGMIGTIGNIALVREIPDFAIKNVALIKNTGNVYYRYLYHCLQSNGITHQLGENLDGGTQKFIALNKIRELIIPVPCDCEQYKIGDYMESLDNLITLHQRKCDNLKIIKKLMLDNLFPKNGKKVPKWRFKGFNNDWEQRKLGDECNQLTTVINPQNEPNRLFAEYSMPAYDLNKNPDYVLGSTMNSARKVVDRPCLLINKLNVRKQRIWCIEDPEKNAVCSAEFIPVCSEGIDLRFLSYVVSGNAFTSYLEDCSSGSSNSQKRVTPDTIMNAEICIPSRAEQQKIGAYFKDLDHLITLHQSEVERLKKAKQFFLDKMFI